MPVELVPAIGLFGNTWSHVRTDGSNWMSCVQAAVDWAWAAGVAAPASVSAASATPEAGAELTAGGHQESLRFALAGRRTELPSNRAVSL